MASIEQDSYLGASGWRKSSRSNAGGECIEAAVVWRKSSRSNAGGNCVEATPARTEIAVRDSKDPYGPKLAFPPREWVAFARRIQRGDLPT